MDINVLSRVESFYPLLRGARSDSVLGDATAATQLAASSPLPEQPAAEKETDAGDAAHAEAAAGPAPAPPARSVASGRLASAEAAASRGHKQRLHASVAALLLHNLAKGCALGWSSTTAVLLLYALQRQQARRPLALVASVEHARWAAFFGVLLAAHNGVARALGPGLHYGGAAAGAVGGLALALAPRPARGHVALLCAVRAAEVAARHAAGKGVWPAFVARHGSLVVMCAASAPVLFCWLFSGHSLDPGYLRFLNRQSGKTLIELRAIAAAFEGTLRAQPALLAAVNARRRRQGAPPLPLPPPLGCSHCAALHGGGVGGCASHALSYITSGFARALPLYAPVHVLPLLLFRSDALRRAPLAALAGAATAVGRSAAFLSTYCAAGFLGMCALSRLGGAAGLAPDRRVAALAGLACGLTLLIEKPSRRVELALYTTTQALRCSPVPAKGGWLRERSAVPAFVLACAVLGHHHARHPHTFRPSYQALLGRLFDGDATPHRRLLS